jgi:hypothetical protein
VSRIRFGIYAEFPQGILIDSHSPPWSPSLVLQLVSEPIWSLVYFNRLCDLNATCRKVLLSLWSSMTSISVTGKIKLATIF